MSKTILAQPTDHGKRLDIFLTEQLQDQSRSHIQKLIKSKAVLVNGSPSSVHHFLKSGDQISIEELASVTFSPVTHTPDAITKPLIEPTIIYEDNDYVVIEKPVGLLVHATAKGERNTLVDWLIARYPGIEDVGEHKYRSGIIHRLDRDVSGVMVVAKNQAAFDHLKEQFKTRQISKVYVAVVYGKIETPTGSIDLPIGRNKEGQFVAHPRHGLSLFHHNDRVAKTEYRVLQYLKDYTVVEVKILTGRTHQIRAHFSAIGHPILGDQLYQPKDKIFHFLRRKIKIINPAMLGRIFLHSHIIGFYNRTDEWCEYSSPVPYAITTFINEKSTT